MDVPRDEKKANFLEGVTQQAKFVATSIVSVRTLEKNISMDFIPMVKKLIMSASFIYLGSIFLKRGDICT